MAISINWSTKIIFVPKADTTLIQLLPVEIRELDLNWFRYQLKDLEDDEAGMPFLDTHRHVTETTLGGITYARVIEIINDYTVTFEDGQYAVNLTGANSNVGDVVNLNQVSVRSNNSAGLISLPDVQYSSFNGGVTLDETSIYSGIVYPTGTPRQPVNNLTDAMLIATYRGFTTIYIIGDAAIDSGGDYSDMNFVGESMTKSDLTISANANVTNCEFYDAYISGTLDGNARLKGCRIENLNYVYGVIEQCMLDAGEILLGGSNPANFLDCWSGVPGVSTPTINMGGSGQSLSLRNYNGGIRLKNKSGSESVSIDLNSGHVILDSDVTNGTIVIRGVGKLTDNSAGATVDADYLLSPGSIADGVHDEVVEGTITLRQAMRAFLSTLVGISSGGDTSNIKFRDMADTKNRINETVDLNGNRLTVSLDLT